MGIVDEDIARVRAATDFVAVAGEHLALRRVGTRWVGLCPFHTEKSGSFSLNAELGFYYCFGCGAKGDVITFVRELEHLDFVEAVEKLAARAGITLRYDDQATGRDHQRRTRIHETLDQAVTWYHERLLSAPDASAARGYLRSERGYDGDVVRHYRLGWAPDGWDQLVRGLGLPAGALVDAGLATVDESGRYTDFFRGRLLFPIFEAGGRPVGAGGRLLPGGRGPKYKNTSGTTVYDKSKVLYGLNWAKKAVVETGQVVVCEGYTDVIGLQQAGIGEAVATCGTALADGHIRLLTNFARRIVLAYDADAAGQAAAERYYEWERRFEVDIRVAALPAGSDPADLAQRDPAALARAVAEARPYLGFRLERLMARADLSTPEGRARAASEAMAMVGEHPNELVRDQYLMQVADRCRVDPARLRPLAARGGRANPAAGGDGRRSVASAPASSSPEQDGDAPIRVTVGGPEQEALRLAVHHPEVVADRLELALFAHPLARACFEALSAATTLHDAIEAADPQAADLLQRLAVEDTDADADDVMVRLVERAGQRAVAGLQAEMRQADPADQAAFAPTVAWCKLTLEILRADDMTDRAAALEAEQRLVGWLVARDAAERHTEATLDE
ncbi:MAG TPA: DNA primase [Acidimicrobiales bacterium]